MPDGSFRGEDTHAALTLRGFLAHQLGDVVEAEGWLARHGSAYPTLLDPGHLTAVDYGVTGVPETFFIDRDGVITEKVALPLGWIELVEKLEGLL